MTHTYNGDLASPVLSALGAQDQGRSLSGSGVILKSGLEMYASDFGGFLQRSFKS